MAGFRLGFVAVVLGALGCSSSSTNPEGSSSGGTTSGGSAGKDGSAGVGGSTSSGGTGSAGGRTGTGGAAGTSGAGGTGLAGAGGGDDAGACSIPNGGPPVEQVGDPAPCLSGSTLVVFDGQGGDYIHPGDDTITQGSWDLIKYSPTDVELTLYPLVTSQGTDYRFGFSSAQLNEPLMQKTYLNAQRMGLATPGHPGLEIAGNGKGCNTIAGKFQIHELELQDAQKTGVCTLSRLTATFEQSCDGGPVLRGCVHYE